MKSIKESYLFKLQDKTYDLEKKMIAYQPSLDDLDLELIDEPLTTIRKRFNGYPARNIILNDLGLSIKPIFNKERIHIPVLLPAYLMNNPHPKGDLDRVIAIVNLTNYARYNNKDNLLDIEPRQLFALLQTGESLLTCIKKWNSITMSQNICKVGSLIYSRFFIKVLDKMFAVNFDRVKADKIKFVASKFFLINMLEKNSSSDIINNMAYGNCTGNTSRNTINQFNEDFNPNAYLNFANLLQQLALEVEGLGALTVRTFLDTAMKLYGQSVVLAFDYFPMFLHMVFSVVIGARFNSEFVLEGVLGREADILYNDFNNFMR
jgi:hypothetical protein